MSSSQLVDHFFRHEYGRLVAVLIRRVGAAQLEAVEDAVSAALMRALETWPHQGQPDQPSAWLYRVASNHLLGELRRDHGRRRLLDQKVEAPPDPPLPAARLQREIDDDLLQMLFVCCDPNLAIESQLALALKTLCGFSVHEICQRLFTQPDNIYKRLQRARGQLAQLDGSQLDVPTTSYAPRRAGVHRVLHLLFTEGYLSCHAEHSLRRELCEEALRLTRLLVEHPVGREPEGFALLALMELHHARFLARKDESGGLLLLEEQDRSQWSQSGIQRGLFWLARSAEGPQFSRFHAEAGIAAEHCMAPSFAETRWDRIVACYDLLLAREASTLHHLNRAVALAEVEGPRAALAALADLRPSRHLAESYLWTAVHADLHRRAGHADIARDYATRALAKAPNAAVVALLRRRLQI